MKLVTWWGWAASRLNRTWEALSLGVEGHEDAGAESVFLGGGECSVAAANSCDWVPVSSGMREDSGPGQIERDRD